MSNLLQRMGADNLEILVSNLFEQSTLLEKTIESLESNQYYTEISYGTALTLSLCFNINVGEIDKLFSNPK